MTADGTGRMLHTLPFRVVRWVFNRTIGKSIDARIKSQLLHTPVVFGDESRLTIDPTAIVNNATFNLVSGHVTIAPYVFFGHNVSLLTGTHDISKRDRDRQLATPTAGRDIVICRGAWLASNCTVIGPSVIGEHSVVASGAVVVGDVAPFTVVGGVPSKTIGIVPE